jgi:hypothetical protein
MRGQEAVRTAQRPEHQPADGMPEPVPLVSDPYLREDQASVVEVEWYVG